MLITHCVLGSQRLSKCRDRHKAMHRVWFFSAVGPSNKSADVETDEQREDRLQLAHDRGNVNMVQHSSVMPAASSVRAVCSRSGSPHNVLHGTHTHTLHL